ncbi:MAG: hypothetical protein LC789_18420 [Actinobacteria bacterium]|nr:hypothetical protein [Actinomycetota bacterium]
MTTALRRRFAAVPVAWRRALVAAIALRVATAVAAFAFAGLLVSPQPAIDVEPVRGTSFEGWDAPSPGEQGVGLLGAGLERWDAGWYLAIARSGYPDRDHDREVPAAAAFFPLFPLLVGVVGRAFGGMYLLAANIVTIAATVAALAGVHRIVEVETGDDDLSRRSLIAIAVFPAAFFLVAPYTESLFLALSAWALVAARRGRFGRAALLAVAAGMTRNVGVLLAIPLALEWWRQVREHRPGHWLLRVAALLGAPAGLGLYLAYAQLHMGRWNAPIVAQQGWERDFAWPTETLVEGVKIGTMFPGVYAGGYHSVELIIATAVIGALIWMLLRVPLPYALYTLAHVLVWLVNPFPGRPLMSTYRFALAVAPLGWAFGVWTRRPAVAAAWCAASGALLGVLLLLFVTWNPAF